MDGKPQPDDGQPGWQYTPGNAVSPSAAAQPEPVPYAPVSQPYVVDPRSVASPPTGSDGSITWTASEFIAHQKNTGWYGLLTVGAIVAAIIVWFVSKDVLSSIVIVLAAVAFGVMASKQPRDLQYRLDESGLSIGQRHYYYGMFRSFSIVIQGAFASIVFMPLKRFAPLITVHYDPKDEEKIIDLLSERLPMEERKQDPVDRLMWRIRF